MTKLYFLLLSIIICIVETITTSSEINVLYMNPKAQQHICTMYSDKCMLNVSTTRDDHLNFTLEKDQHIHIEWVKEYWCKNYTDIHNNNCSYANTTSDHHSDYYKVYTIKFNPILFGTTKMFILTNHTNNVNHTFATIVVTQPYRLIDRIFNVWVYIFQTFISLIMGVLIDLSVIMKIMKMPVPVIFGVCCQYTLMPLLAIGFLFIFKLSPIQSLALFIYGCSPGGAASNNWTILYDGDLDLSAMLTFLSTLASLFMMPAWIYSVGRIYMEQGHFHIPFFGLVRNLLITIAPCLVGILLSHFCPKSRGILSKIAKPFTLIVVLTFLVLIVTTKLYIFKLFELKHWLAGPLIPWTGFVISFILASIMRFPLKQVKTITIETGIQNVGVAFLIIISNFPLSEADYAILPLMSVGLMTNLPLYLVYGIMKLVIFIRNKRNKSKLEIHEYKIVENKEMMPLNGAATENDKIRV